MISDVRSALVKAFNDAALFPSDAVVYENNSFVPPLDKPWATVYFVPTQPTVASLGDAGQDMQNGFLQIDLNYPLNNGEKAQADMFEQLRMLYKAGKTFTYSGQAVTIRSCGRSQGRVIDNVFRVSVTVMFWAHINR